QIARRITPDRSEYNPAKAPQSHLHNAVAQHRMLSGEQILHEIITAFIRVARSAREMMVDSHSRRPTEIICNGKNFARRFTLAEQPLRVRTCRTDRKQFRGDTDKSGKEQLLAIELRAEPRHRMKQSAC